MMTVMGHFNYCIEVWGNTYKNNINQVFILRKVIRIVCHARSLDHASQMSLSIRHFEDI